jgi:cystine transport system permease protein
MSLELFMEVFTKIFIGGITVTIPLTIISFFFAMIIAILVAIVQVAKVPVLKQLARLYVWFIRGTPLIVQLYIVYFGLPYFNIKLSGWLSAVLVFSINTGAYASETMRGAIESVPKGQFEAGYCVGMSYSQIMTRIILPQAMKIAFPSLGNSLISLTKDTSLAASITVGEMFLEAQKIVSRTWETFPIYLSLAFVYLFFCTIMEIVQRKFEKKMDLK